MYLAFRVRSVSLFYRRWRAKSIHHVVPGDWRRIFHERIHPVAEKNTLAGTKNWWLDHRVEVALGSRRAILVCAAIRLSVMASSVVVVNFVVLVPANGSSKGIV